MPTIALTSDNVKTLRCIEGSSETIYWSQEAPGFGLRCRASGERRWFVQFRNKDGQTRKFTLESPEEMSLAAARRRAKDLLADVTKGRDPAAEAGKVRALLTVGELAAAYLAHQERQLRPRSFAEVARHLSAFYPPIAKLLDRKAATVAARDVVQALDQIATSNGPVAANRVRASLRAMWSWGLKTQRLSVPNPVTDTFKPAKEAPRARVLSDHELTLIWRSAGSGAYGAIVRLLMLTGHRREEVAGMRWSEIELLPDGWALWTIPPKRSKNNLAHEVPLSPTAVALLPPKREEGEEHVRDLVFGGNQGGTHKAWAEQRAAKYRKPDVKYGEDNFSAWSRSKDRLDGRLAKANGTADAPKAIPGWVLHDLRRTFVTGLNNHGVEPHVIEAAVNHTSGASKAGVAGVYNRARYTAQVRDAMATWASHIQSLTTKREPAVPEAA